MHRKAFTLLEILIVIAILAVLATVTVVVVNPAEYLKQSRDAKRIADVETLTRVYNLALVEGKEIGEPNIVYISTPDQTLSGGATSTCVSLGLPALESGYQYRCVSEENVRKIDGTGWIPIELTSLTTGSPLPMLPLNPVSATTSGNYYTYTATGGISSTMESQKYIEQKANNDGGYLSTRYEAGLIVGLPRPACTSFTYTGWDVCQATNTQTRTIVSSLPSGCAGGTPVVSQLCSYGNWQYAAACSNILVYTSDVAPNIWQYGPLPTSCTSPQCSGGALVADNAVNFGMYPARQDCKNLGGRLPTQPELLCMYNNKASYTGLSPVADKYYWSANQWTAAQAHLTNMYNGSQNSMGNKDFWSGQNIRCVK